MTENEINEKIMQLLGFELTPIGWCKPRDNFNSDCFAFAPSYATDEYLITNLIERLIHQYKLNYDLSFTHDLGEWSCRLANKKFDTGYIFAKTRILAKCMVWIKFMEQKDVSKRWVQDS